MNSFPEDPPEQPGCITLSGVLALLVAILLLAALLPCGLHPYRKLDHARRTDCANHLWQLYKLGVTYAATHRGKWPEAEGGQLWASFAECHPPLIEGDQLEILCCPVKGEDPFRGATDYRGPSKPPHLLQPADFLGADKPGNHGDTLGGNLLRMDGSVLEAAADDREWLRCELALKP